MADYAGDWASNPQYQQRIRQLLPAINQVAQRYGLPPEAVPYMLANAGIESRWNVNSPRGSANDVGLLQITPILAKDYNAPHTTDPNTQLDVIGQYYARAIKQGLPLDTAATGWNTGMGRAAQVNSGKRTWESITPMAARYNTAVNAFVNSNQTKSLLGSLGINYNSNQRSPAVSRTMQQYGIVDRGPVQKNGNVNFTGLAEGLTGVSSDNLAPAAAPAAEPVGVSAVQNNGGAAIPMTDLQLDGILHNDLGLGERLF